MTTIAGLSPAKVATLEAVIALTVELGKPPTYEQIAERRGLGISTVGHDLVVLQTRGWVRHIWIKRANVRGRMATVALTDRTWPPVAASTTTESAAAA